MAEPTDRPRRVFATWTYLRNGRAEIEDDVDKYELNETGTRLWLRFDGRPTIAELSAALAADTGADEAACLADSLSFVDKLVEYKLLELVP